MWFNANKQRNKQQQTDKHSESADSSKAHTKTFFGSISLDLLRMICGCWDKIRTRKLFGFQDPEFYDGKQPKTSLLVVAN